MKTLTRVCAAVALLLKGLGYALLYGTPLLGVWLASSLCAYLGGPRQLVVASGVLLFPILPLLWEWRATRARARRERPPERVLTFLDRLSLRTFAVGAAVVLGLLALFPRQSFMALSTRGDWMLAGVERPWVPTARAVLFRTADGVEWLYRATLENPFEEQVARDDTPLPDDFAPRAGEVHREHPDPAEDPPTPRPTPPPAPSPTPAPEVEPPPPPPPTDAPTPRPAAPASAWPWTGRGLHPAVTSLGPEDEVDLETAARALVRGEEDPFLRVKALHDYVADRVAYDAEALFAGRYPDQRAETVFRTRKAVCAGYANLLEAMGEAVGERVMVVLGTTRKQEEQNDSAGHAWNAVEIDGGWYLMDATWDSGTVSREEGFEKRYRAAYLMAPPEAFGLTHFPEEPRWQLRERPLSLGDFLRQPRLSPEFLARGLELVSPRRSRTDTHGEAVVEVHNPGGVWLRLAPQLGEGRIGEMGGATRAPLSRLEADLPEEGLYRLALMAGESEYGRYWSVGTLDFVNR